MSCTTKQRTYKDVIREKTPTELNDGLDPEEEQKFYQGTYVSEDGIYIGTYSFFVFLGSMFLVIVWILWALLPQQVYHYFGLDFLYNFLPGQFVSLSEFDRMRERD